MKEHPGFYIIKRNEDYNRVDQRLPFLTHEQFKEFLEEIKKPDLSAGRIEVGRPPGDKQACVFGFYSKSQNYNLVIVWLELVQLEL